MIVVRLGRVPSCRVHRTGGASRSPEPTFRNVFALTFGSDGTQLVSATRDHTLRPWRARWRCRAIATPYRVATAPGFPTGRSGFARVRRRALLEGFGRWQPISARSAPDGTRRGPASGQASLD